MSTSDPRELARAELASIACSIRCLAEVCDEDDVGASAAIAVTDALIQRRLDKLRSSMRRQDSCD